VPVVFSTDSFFSGKNFALPSDQQSLSRWFDTSQFQRFPDKTADITAYPTWTGVMSLPGANYKPAAGDTIKNGVYQDFKTWVSDNSPYHGTVRNPYMNNWNIGLRKNVPIREAIRLQLRFDAFNALNHPQFGSVNTDPNNAYFGYFSGSATPSAVNSPRSIQLEGKLYF